MRCMVAQADSRVAEFETTPQRRSDVDGMQVHDLQTEAAKTGTELREAVAAAALAREAAERSGADLRGQLSAATAQVEQLSTQLLSVKAAAFDTHLADRNSRCISGHLFCAAENFCLPIYEAWVASLPCTPFLSHD